MSFILRAFFAVDRLWRTSCRWHDADDITGQVVDRITASVAKKDVQLWF